MPCRRPPDPDRTCGWQAVPAVRLAPLPPLGTIIDSVSPDERRSRKRSPAGAIIPMSTRIAKPRGQLSRAMRVIWWAAVSLFVAVGTSDRVWAQWVAHVEGADAYGEPAFVAVSAARSGDALLVLCDQTKLLALAYLMPGTPTELAEMSKSGAELPVTLLVKIGDGAQ